MLRKTWILFLCAVIFSSCDLLNIGGDKKKKDNDKIEIPEKIITGNIKLPANTRFTSTEEFKVISAVNSKNTQQGVNFELDAIDSENHQVVFVNSESGNPILLSTYAPDSNENEISIKTTALSLVLMNPIFMGTSKLQRDEVLAKAESNPRFYNLVDDIETLLESDPENVLNYERHPSIYVDAAKIALDILKNSKQYKRSQIISEDVPWIEDVPNNEDIMFYNPKTIYYGVSIAKKNSSDASDVLALSAKSSLWSYEFGLPPVVWTEPTTTEYELGNGDFEIEVVKGFDFSDNTYLNWNTANGKATMSNIGKSIVQIFDLVAGFDLFPSGSLAELIYDSKRNFEISYDMGTHIAEKKPLKVFGDFLGLIVENKEVISYVIWQSSTSAQGAQYISSITHLLGNANAAWKVVSTAEKGVNRFLPFVYDLIKSPKAITINISQQSGNILESDINNAPNKPEFVSLNEVYRLKKGEIFNFPIYANDPNGNLISYRLNFGGGKYSEWSEFVKSGEIHGFPYEFEEAGEYTLTAEAKDEYGAVSESSEPIFISVYPENVFFAYNFDKQSIGELPNSPPWEVNQVDPSYIQIVSNNYSSDLSAAFYDYDPDLENSADESYASIFTDLEVENEGEISFSFKVADESDSFGLRIWDELGNWNKLGYYITFHEGYLAYYDPYGLHDMLKINANEWYDITISYNIMRSTYDVYIDSIPYAENIRFYGEKIEDLRTLQIVAFSDAQCKTGFVDNIEVLGGVISKEQNKKHLSTEILKNISRMYPD